MDSLRSQGLRLSPNSRRSCNRMASTAARKDRPKLKSAHEVIHALRMKYDGNAYAFMEQVGDGTGARAYRWCDALVMSLWPSRGLDLIGIEVKVSRSDFLKELSLPQKADAIAKFCDYWYLAVGDENIVQAGELPSTWGLLVPDSKGNLRCRVEATKLEAQPISRSFLAAVLRQASVQITDVAKMIAEYNRGVEIGRKEAEETAKHSRENWKQMHAELDKSVRDFERVSGVRINNWQGGEKIGHAVQLVLSNMGSRIKGQLEDLHGQALRIVTNIENELAKENL